MEKYTLKRVINFFIFVVNLSDLLYIIIPFFQQYPLYSAKHLDFLDFKKGLNIYKTKDHLTSEGLRELKELAYKLNSFRKF